MPSRTAQTDWGLDDAITVTDVRTAGGILQEDENAEAVVHLQVVGRRISDGQEIVLPFILDLERYFVMMARLEWAGKTALLMPSQDRVSPG